LGSPALTTRGLGTKEFKLIAEIIDSILKNYQNTKTKKEVKDQIKQIIKNLA